jgi:hypothetical protein
MSLREARKGDEAILPLRRLLRARAIPERVEGGLALTYVYIMPRSIATRNPYEGAVESATS